MTLIMARDDFQALSFLQRHEVFPDRRDFAGMVFARDGRIIGAAGIDALATGIHAFTARHDATIHCAGTGWARSTLRSFFRWVFVELGFKRLTSEIAIGNVPSLRMTEGVGFRREGIRRGAAPDGGDIIILGCLAAECRYGG